MEEQDEEKKMGWFKRLKDGIQTATKSKREAPDGLWNKCASCGELTTVKELKDNLYVCPKCEYHNRIGSADYFSILFDDKYEELFSDIVSIDPLQFEDLKPYTERLKSARKKNKVTDAITVGVGKVGKKDLVVAAMDFSFIGGSMGSVVGERISKAIDYSIEHRIPFMIISKSGGARMMEAAFSLMQMAKTSAKLAMLAEQRIPYISLMTDPTTGGVTASFAMLGDLNIAEPKALIGFAGPRVIKETIKKDLPDEFQTAEFLLEHGFLDFVVHRKELRQKMETVLELLQPAPLDVL